jgi:exonuclease SbcD
MLRILHTSDWHLGQTLRDIDREAEHSAFLKWLGDLLEERSQSAMRIHALLLSGDVFDSPNPSARAQKLFYDFVERTRKFTKLIVTAGNHDSAERLQAPAPVLGSLGVSVIGAWPAKDQDLGSFVCYIKGDDESAFVLAEPFLRVSDLGSFSSEDAESHFVDAHRNRYKQLYEFACHERTRIDATAALIGMGHCYVAGSSINEDTERRVGNQDELPVDIFPRELAYVALGHLHKAQIVAKQEHIRYSGSPIPLGFSEVDYHHQVLEVEIFKGVFHSATPHIVPRHRPFLQIPKTHAPWSEVETMLRALPLRLDRSLVDSTRPLLEVQVKLPDLGVIDLRERVQALLGDKWPQLFRIDAVIPEITDQQKWEQESRSLEDLSPQDVFLALCAEKGVTELARNDLLADFNSLLQDARELGTSK